MDEESKPAIPPENFGYLELPKEGWMRQEGFKDKLIRKTKENPLVPLGLAATIIALTVGLSTLKTGNQKLSQKMMRWRVGAQGFTVFALIAGVGYQSMSKKDATKTD